MKCEIVSPAARARATGAAVVVLFLAAGSAVAQELTGSIYGKVTDSSGLPVPGVTVTVSSPQLIRAEVIVTGVTGDYRARLLPAGTYAVTAHIEGFRELTRSGINLPTGAALAVNLVMDVSGVNETVTVAGEVPLVDVKNSQNTRTIDSTVLETVPVGRSFHEIVKTLSGVIDGEYNFAPVQAVHGSTVRENVYTVDGAGANDTTVGYMTTEIPYDMIEEVQVITAGTTAEFSQGGGAVFRFITKSGGNNFSGSVNFFGEGSALTGNNLDDELIAQGISSGSEPIKNFEYGASLGGPLKRDSVWFFGNLRWVDTELTLPDFPENKVYDQRQSFAKVTSQLGNTRVHGSFTEGIFREWVDQGDFTIAASPENWRDQKRHQRIVAGGANHVFGKSTYLEVRASRSFKGFDPEFPNNPEGTSGFIDVATGLHSGGHTRPDRLRKKMDQGQLSATLTHSRPKLWGASHDFKTGFLYEIDPYEQAEVFYDGQDTLRILNRGAAHRVRLYNTPVGKTATNATVYAGFVQDQVSFKQLTLNVGVRYENAEGWTPEQEYGGGRWVERTMVPEERDLINLTSLSPRLGAVWAINNHTSLRGSYGRYYTRLLVGHVPNPIGSDYQEFDWIDSNGDLELQLSELGTQRRSFGAFTRPPKDPDLKTPYTDGFNIGVDRQVWRNVGISVAGIFKREREIFENLDVARPFSAYVPLTVTNPIDGQPLTIFALDPAFQTVRSVLVRTNPKDPVPLYRDYNGLEIALRKRLSNRWYFDGSMNVGRSKGNIGTSFGYSSGAAGIYNDPNTLINVDGPLDLDSPFQLKLIGGWEAPYGVLLSGYYAGLSGIPIHPPENFPNDPALGAYTVRFTRADNPGIVAESFIQVAGVQRGTYRQDFRHNLSLRGEKRVQMRGATLKLTADVFNVLNVNTVTAVQTLKVDLPNFLVPARIVSPRLLRLAVQFEF